MKQLPLLSFVCGTLIVLAPIVQNVASLAMMTHLLAIDPQGHFDLHGSLSNSYQGWCMFVGMSLFVVGVVSGFRASGEGMQAAASKEIILGSTVPNNA